MITASHNPKEDNGLKVYWSNGAQIIPPLDAHITQSILANLNPWYSDVWGFDGTCDGAFIRNHAGYHDVTDELSDAYFSAICSRISRPLPSPDSYNLKIAYTGIAHIELQFVI